MKRNAAPRKLLVASALALLLGGLALVFVLLHDAGRPALAPPARVANTPAAPAPAELPAPAPAALDPEPLLDEAAVPDAVVPGEEPAAGSADSPPLDGFVVIVVDDSARPVPGAHVTVVAGLASQAKGGAPPDVLTDETGHARVELVVGPNSWVSAAKDGLGQSPVYRYRDLNVQRQAGDDVVLRLAPDTIIDGIVLTADGAPAADCLVGCRGDYGKTRVLIGTPTNIGGPMSMVALLRTPGDGRFQVALRRSSPVTLLAQPRDAPLVSQTFDVPPDGHASVTLRLPGRWTIDGEVFDPAGNPAKGVNVVGYHAADLRDPWNDLSRQRAPGRLTVGVAANGTFHIAATALEPHVIWATNGQVCSDPVLVVLDAQHPAGHATLRFGPTLAITGRVVTPDGLPVRGGALGATTVSPPVAGLFRGINRAAMTDDGVFTIPYLHRNEVLDLHLSMVEVQGNIRVSLAGSPEIVVPHVAAGTTDLVIVADFTRAAEPSPADAGALAIVVRSALGGFVPPNIRWRVLPEGSDDSIKPVQKSSDPAGELHLDGLQPGAGYTLIVGADDHGTVDLHGLIASPSPQPVRVDLPALASLQVEVVDAGGAPLRYAEVVLQRDYTTLGFHLQRPRGTDAGGHARFTEVDPGSYRVSVTLGGAVIEQRVEIRPGESARVRLKAAD